MASRSANANVGVLILITVIGLVLGSFFSVLIEALLKLVSSEGGNVLGIFVWSVPIGIGVPNPVLIDLNALKFQFGFQLNINAMSFLGLWLAHKFYKSNR